MGYYEKSQNYPINLIYILYNLSHLCLRQVILSLLIKLCTQLRYQGLK